MAIGNLIPCNENLRSEIFMSETIKEKSQGRVSYHDSVEEMVKRIRSDGIFALAYGAYTHLSPTPFMTGAPQLIELLTNKAEDVTDGSIALGDDPVEVSNNIEAHIMKKRKALGLS